MNERDMLCKSCRFYREITIVEYKGFWLFKKNIEVKKEKCARFGPDMLSLELARGYLKVNASGFNSTFVQGPCGLEGKYWRPK